MNPFTIMVPITFMANLLQMSGQSRLSNIVRSLGKRTALDYWALVEERTSYRARVLSALDAGRFDAIICPPTSMPAGVVAATRVRAGEESDRTPGKDTAERTARAVEAGSAGLPVGVQVVARHWREDVALALMTALEEQFRMQPDCPARRPI
jgi:fatty acid amide hydrolase